MPGSQRLRREGLLWQQVGDQVVVLDADRSMYLAVNETGSRIWQALVDGCPTDELTRILVDQYGIDPDRAAGDVARFVGDLDERGLLESPPS